ncbi:hypothetical protein PS2_040195 [Malus domestica]
MGNMVASASYPQPSLIRLTSKPRSKFENREPIIGDDPQPTSTRMRKSFEFLRRQHTAASLQNSTHLRVLVPDLKLRSKFHHEKSNSKTTIALFSNSATHHLSRHVALIIDNLDPLLLPKKLKTESGVNGWAWTGLEACNLVNEETNDREILTGLAGYDGLEIPSQYVNRRDES